MIRFPVLQLGHLPISLCCAFVSCMAVCSCLPMVSSFSLSFAVTGSRIWMVDCKMFSCVSVPFCSLVIWSSICCVSFVEMIVGHCFCRISVIFVPRFVG